jgi:hypothetical protein
VQVGHFWYVNIWFTCRAPPLNCMLVLPFTIFSSVYSTVWYSRSYILYLIIWYSWIPRLCTVKNYLTNSGNYMWRSKPNVLYSSFQFTRAFSFSCKMIFYYFFKTGANVFDSVWMSPRVLLCKKCRINGGGWRGSNGQNWDFYISFFFFRAIFFLQR